MKHKIIKKVSAPESNAELFIRKWEEDEWKSYEVAIYIPYSNDPRDIELERFNNLTEAEKNFESREDSFLKKYEGWKY